MGIAQDHAQRHTHRHVGNGPADGNEQRPVEILVVDDRPGRGAADDVEITEDAHVVREAGPDLRERLAHVQDGLGGERQGDAVHEREEDQEQHPEHRGQNVEIRVPVLLEGAPRPAGVAQGEKGKDQGAGQEIAVQGPGEAVPDDPRLGLQALGPDLAVPADHPQRTLVKVHVPGIGVPR